jgi:tetratricopeptide (TPR) repeat protein
MPSHIYIRVGRYGDGTEANRKAIVADEDYITQCRAQGIYPAGYYPHNIHFLFATLSMEGRSREAHDAAVKVSTRHNHEQMEALGGFAHLLKAMPLFSQVRFAKWDDILAAPDPGSDMKFVQAIRHFARGYAFVAKGDAAKADAELSTLRVLAKDPAVTEVKILELNSLGQLTAIAENMLAGEIAAARKNTREAVRLLNRAVEIEDNLLYSEPPDWPLPPRQYLGVILLNAGRAKEAEAAFRKDLDRHRNNGWSLRGLADSLIKQGKTADAARAEESFRKAWSRADFELRSARL